MRALVFGVFLFVAAPASAVSIVFQAIDLVDVTPGEDLWQYTYQLDEFPFASGFGFSVEFDPALYGALQDPPPLVHPDWDVITLQPDSGLPAPGLYDALALTGSPSTAAPFEVSFVFLGSGAPGSQPFVVFDDTFGAVETGETVAVPEPRWIGFVLVALVAVWRPRP